MVIPLLAWSKQCEVIVPINSYKFTVLMLGMGGPPCGDCIMKKRRISTQVFGLGRWCSPPILVCGFLTCHKV